LVKKTNSFVLFLFAFCKQSEEFRPKEETKGGSTKEVEVGEGKTFFSFFFRRLFARRSQLTFSQLSPHATRNLFAERMVW